MMPPSETWSNTQRPPPNSQRTETETNAQHPHTEAETQLEEPWNSFKITATSPPKKKHARYRTSRVGWGSMVTFMRYPFFLRGCWGGKDDDYSADCARAFAFFK